MKNKILFLIFTLLSISILALANATSIKALSCVGQCPNGQCDVCDNVTGQCKQCGERGGGIYGQCANNSQCGSECCNGGQCGACGGGGALTCPSGWHPNGSSTPPYCSPDVVITPPPPVCYETSTICFGGCTPGGGYAGVMFFTNSCTGASRSEACYLPACYVPPPVCTWTCPSSCGLPAGNTVVDSCGYVHSCGATALCGGGGGGPVDCAANSGSGLSCTSSGDCPAGEYCPMGNCRTGSFALCGGGGGGKTPIGGGKGGGCTISSWSPSGSCSATCGGGTQIWTNNCGGSESRSCNITACAPDWWQVKDGDITSNGNITSSVPVGSYFNIVGLGGFPGIPVFNGTLTTGASTRISTKNWSANTNTSLTRIFNYSYFENLIPADVTINDISLLSSGGVQSDGYEWFKTTGDYTVSSNIDFTTRKVILFIKTGNMNINSKINLTDNSGFFGAFVNGSIIVAPTVSGTPAIEGVYMADNNLTTGLGTSQLHVRGSIATHGTITLQRDQAVTTTPSELFEFAPDQILLYPSKLMYQRTKWAEVAP